MSLAKEKISNMLAAAVEKAQRDGILPQVPIPEYLIEKPQNPLHGDYACTLPLKLARIAKMNPLQIAQKLVDMITPTDEIESVTAAAPGFLNFTLRAEWLQKRVPLIIKGGSHFGDTDTGKAQKVQIEFVSVNPTGPMHVGHGRGGIIGSTLANVLSAAGFHVKKEYYVNDAGNQIDLFNKSLYARYKQALGLDEPMPADGYMGEYMKDLGKKFADEFGDKFEKIQLADGQKQLGAIGQERMITWIKEDLAQANVSYDNWFSENDLYKKGSYRKAITLLKEQGYVTEKEGAQWFASTILGEDKDNVLVRSTGAPTYFASDVAYHYNKFVERGFDRVIDIWGADHRGHINRKKMATYAMGIDPNRLQILIYQLVTLKRGDEVIRISKRTGNIITLREIIDEVGPDAVRFFFLQRSADSQMEFDLELAKKQSSENPVFYIQYAHARIVSILRSAAERGITWENGDVSKLTDKAELAFIRKMIQLEEVVENAALAMEPHHLPHYAMGLANSFTQFYEHCRVLTPDSELTYARLKLVEAGRIALSRTLTLMGMSTPEKM
ncbi:MAG: arginine--tRNA ligase [Dehalococcoidia bacterium]|nr:arginine--tRNA ligase [Dehalococcoidia bacterium]